MLNIKVVGSGCANCQKFEALCKEEWLKTALMPTSKK